MILKAFEHDPLCLDAYVQLANYLMNKGDQQNAINTLKKIVQEIKIQSNDNIFDEQEDNYEPIPYNLRLNVSKLLIEVELWEEALLVLNGLFDEDTSNLDVSYMLAFVNFKLKNYAQVHDLIQELQK